MSEKQNLQKNLLKGIKKGDLEAVQKAIDEGANINGTCKSYSYEIGWNLERIGPDREEIVRPLLIHAVREHKIAVANLLIKNGANTECEEVVTQLVGPDAGTESKTSFQEALRSEGLVMKKSLTGEPYIWLSKELIKSTKAGLKSTKASLKSLKASNAQEESEGLRKLGPFDDYPFYDIVRPFLSRKNPIKELKMEIKNGRKPIETEDMILD